MADLRATNRERRKKERSVAKLKSSTKKLNLDIVMGLMEQIQSHKAAEEIMQSLLKELYNEEIELS
jgi:hypothetical protein